MAKVLQQESVWLRDTGNFNLQALDVQALSTGKIGVAFGGTAGGTTAIYTGLYDLTGSTLGPLRTKLLPGDTSGGLSVTTVRDIELDAGPAGGMVATFHMLNSAVGADGNFALLTQVYAGANPQGTPHAVNPGDAAQNTYDVFSTITRADGSYLTFSSEIGSGTNLSNGILMTAFRANGTVIGTPRIVIADRFVNQPINIKANPEAGSATFMANGRNGLVFKENIADGGSRVVFQEITQAGALVGPAEVLQGTGATAPQIVTLANGKLLAVWMSVDAFAQSTLKAQLISPTGTPLGSTFGVAASHTGTETRADVVALANGGFAVSWYNGNHPVGRIFDAAGNALGNDFSLTDTSASYDLFGPFGFTVSGAKLIGFASVGNFGEAAVLLGEVFGTGSTLGKTQNGSPAGTLLAGTANDDSFHGLGGRDTLNGLAGNDILDGGNDVDSITGGEGRDVITGGMGRDVMIGGGGGDVFVFNAPGEGGDTIRDFSAAQGDMIGVDNVGFGRELFSGFFLPLLGITLSSGAATDANATGFHFNTTTKVLSYDADGAGALARVDIATLPGVASLSIYDMLVI